MSKLPTKKDVAVNALGAIGCLGIAALLVLLLGAAFHGIRESINGTTQTNAQRKEAIRQAGEEAAKAGLTIENCPYQDSVWNSSREIWINGFNQGEIERRKAKPGGTPRP